MQIKIPDSPVAYGALGNFTLKAIPVANITPRIGSNKVIEGWGVRVKSLSVYLRDQYDFTGDQPLGLWTNSSVSKTPSLGYTCINNENFRDWRARSNYGVDCLVYSAAIKVNLDKSSNIFFPGGGKK